MSALRPMVQDGGLTRAARLGDNVAVGRNITTIATDANLTLTADQMAGGIVRFSSFSAGRTVTTDTAVAILAQNPWMDIGDSYEIVVSSTAAFAATWAAGTGVTLAGRATTPASSYSIIVVTKTGAATVTLTVL